MYFPEPLPVRSPLISPCHKAIFDNLDVETHIYQSLMIEWHGIGSQGMQSVKNKTPWTPLDNID